MSRDGFGEVLGRGCCCAAQSELTATGRQHATQIGAALRGLHLPIAAVRTARLCRALGPGEIAVFGPGPAGKATLLARIGESAWPTLPAGSHHCPLHPKPMTRRSGPGISQLRGGGLG